MPMNEYGEIVRNQKPPKSHLGLGIIIACVVLTIGGISIFSKSQNKKRESENDYSSIVSNEIATTSNPDFETELGEQNQEYDSIEGVSTVSSENLTTENIHPSSLSIDAYPEEKTSIDRIDIQQISDKITEEKETKMYEITSGEAGTYRFELSDVPQNVWFRFSLYNSSMEKLKNGSGDNGDGITAELDANTTYYFEIEQGGNTGSYTFNIGYPKPIIDISSYKSISDSIQFTNQKNIYYFTPSQSGTYRFEFSRIPQNTWFRFYLYNSYMEQLSNGSGDNGDGITVDLDEGKEYYFAVEQGGNTGIYTFDCSLSVE